MRVCSNVFETRASWESLIRRSPNLRKSVGFEMRTVGYVSIAYFWEHPLITVVMGSRASGVRMSTK